LSRRGQGWPEDEWLTRAIERDLTRAEREMLTIVAAPMQRIAPSH